MSVGKLKPMKTGSNQQEMKLPFVTLLSALVAAKIIPDVHEEVYECDSTTPLPAADFSGLEFDFTEDNILTLTGIVNIREDYHAPVGMFFHTERFERGDWRTGIMSRRVADLCPQIKNRFEIWYPITSKMEQQECPYKKGHSERFDKLQIGTFGLMIPPHFLGEWKVYWEITTVRNGKTIKECIMRRVSFVEA